MRMVKKEGDGDDEERKRRAEVHQVLIKWSLFSLSGSSLVSWKTRHTRRDKTEAAGGRKMCLSVSLWFKKGTSISLSVCPLLLLHPVRQTFHSFISPRSKNEATASKWPNMESHRSDSGVKNLVMCLLLHSSSSYPVIFLLSSISSFIHWSGEDEWFSRLNERRKDLF